MSWRAIARELGAPVLTVVDAYRCTEMVPCRGTTAAAESKPEPAVGFERTAIEGFSYTTAE